MAPRTKLTYRRGNEPEDFSPKAVKTHFMLWCANFDFLRRKIPLPVRRNETKTMNHAESILQLLSASNERANAIEAQLAKKDEKIGRIQQHLLRGYYKHPAEAVDDLTHVISLSPDLSATDIPRLIEAMRVLLEGMAEIELRGRGNDFWARTGASKTAPLCDACAKLI